MPQSPAPSENQIPLVVDLDGTLIKTDLLWEHLARLLRRNPFSIFQILFWWMRGRACLKKKLAVRIKVEPSALPYNEKFLGWLREQKVAGRKIILATASDFQMAKPVAEHIGIFDEVFASDGKTNLRSGNKLKVLTEKFGECGFDYAGNSSADLAVWLGAREAVVVNASHSIQIKAAACAKVAATFPENYCRFFIAKRFLNELFWQSGYLLAAVAGLLLAMAFPKINVAGFAWIAPGLLIFAAPGKKSSDAFRVGYVGGLSFWLASLYWLLLMPAPGFSILAWIALCVFLALYFGIWTWLVICHSSLVTRHWPGRLLWSLLGAAVWVALEMIRARLFGGFPWSFIGVSQHEMVPLIQIASVTGIYGISFLVVWTSLSFFSAVRMVFAKPDSRFAWQPEIALPLFVVAGLFAFGGFQTIEQTPAANAPMLRIALVQPSVPQTLIWDENENTNRFQQLLALSENALNENNNPLTPALSPSGGEREKDMRTPNSLPSPRPNGEKVAEGRMRGASKTDLLIWPESAVPEFNDANYAAITNFVRAHHVWLIFNADDVVPRLNAKNEFDNDVFNAAFLFDPDGKFAGVYHKQELVIFGEYIPLVRWLPFVKWFTPVTGSFAAGNEPAQFEMNSGVRRHVGALESGDTSPHSKAAPLICFEDTFPQTARKAARDDTDFLVNLTNDGWFGNSAEQWQHEANSIFRAVENGIPLVRCANNGVTCWIDANGRVREIFRNQNKSVYGKGAMTVDLPLSSHAQTFYNRHGDWFGWSCVIWTAVITVRHFLRRKISAS
ncbi:MAG TPA: apolipoprotein N-acyltransferase [Methylomirabilota bacterium]|nr:apolipoprotein N-acyltransferase [Methylomirabilota bacterium]